MPNISDVFKQLEDANSKLDTLNGDLQIVSNHLVTLDTDVKSGFSDAVQTLNAGFTTMATGMQAIIALQSFANRIRLHHSEQYDTMICVLEKISRNTCSLVTEAHTQTGLQTSIETHVSVRTELLKSGNAAAALELERLNMVRKQVEMCCPPKPEPPACSYEPCQTSSFTESAPTPEIPTYVPVVTEPEKPH